MPPMDNIAQIAEQFALPCRVVEAAPYGNGHINDTYRIICGSYHFLLQRLNSYVFPHPEEVMENLVAVTTWLHRKIREEGGDPARETLTIVPAKDNAPYYTDSAGGVWRMYIFVTDTVTYDLPETAALFEETGRGFGLFGRRLDGYPTETLHEVIPGFHDTPARYEQLQAAAERDACGRLSGVLEEMEFCHSRKGDLGILMQARGEGILPVRVTHNDTKINNLLIDKHTGRALCVIDLDTVMPGLAACDFGEAIRTGASTAAEDERDLSRISLSMDMYRAFARGYLLQMDPVLTLEEIRLLPEGPRLMALENGMRFLADYLNGDKYFKIHRKGQNLDRARAQFTLAVVMERKMGDMHAALLEFLRKR